MGRQKDLSKFDSVASDFAVTSWMNMICQMGIAAKPQQMHAILVYILFTRKHHDIPKGLIWNTKVRKKILYLENKEIKSIGRWTFQEFLGTEKKTAAAGHARGLSSVAGVSTSVQQGKSNLLPIHSSAVQIKRQTKLVNFHPSPALFKPKYRFKKINNPNRWENIFSL